MSQILKVVGGNPLFGEVTPVPNKNAILPAIAACILTDQIVTYKNFPKTTDVQKMFEMLKKMGAEIDDTNYSEIKVSCKNLNSYHVDPILGNEIRSSLLFAGSLLARFGKAVIPLPGGCVLGKRSISAHLDSFFKVGIEAEFGDNSVTFTAPKTPLASYQVWQMEASVTATENLCLYAAGVSSQIEIIDAASEPHVAQLLELLKQMGAKVLGIGSNKITLSGVKNLQGADFIPEPDFVDVGGLIVAAVVTKGKITLKGANIPYAMDGLIQTFEKFNVNIQKVGSDLVVDGAHPLKIDVNNSGFPLAGPDLPKLVPRPWPGFPVDVLPVMVTLGCKTPGKLMVQNWMYETGLDFVKELNAMGANIFVADPQRIIVNGPVTFGGGKITVPSVIQAAKAIFLASLADKATTELTGLEILKRRYPNAIEIYKSLGANLEILNP